VRGDGVSGAGEGGRWRAVWKENGARRQCEAASEDRLAARLEKVTERLMADAPNQGSRRGPPHDHQMTLRLNFTHYAARGESVGDGPLLGYGHVLTAQEMGSSLRHLDAVPGRFPPG
jgi:hypothetical protein